jgi:hypothetical protein
MNDAAVRIIDGAVIMNHEAVVIDEASLSRRALTAPCPLLTAHCPLPTAH